MGKIITQHLKDFKEFLSEKEYSKGTAGGYAVYVSHFQKWQDSKMLQSNPEIAKDMQEYLATQSVNTSRVKSIRAALYQFYRFNTGNIYKCVTLIDDANPMVDSEMKNFEKYLHDVAAIKRDTIADQCSYVKRFLLYSFKESDFNPKLLTNQNVRKFLTTELVGLSPSSKKTIVTKIRRYFKYLMFNGIKIDESILKLPLTMPVWSKSSVPKYLEPEEIKLLYSAYDANTKYGIRDFAIAVCFIEMGLRCSEVANLSLDDIDWSIGTINIKNTKSHNDRILPLAKIVGAAVVEYLTKFRIITSERKLFLRFKHMSGQAMGCGQIRATIRRAAERAKLKNFTGTHMLRHTKAKEMISNGASLKMIADVLGHESIDTSSVYVKVNFDELVKVAVSWPEVSRI